MMFRSLPTWALVLGFLFPLTIPFAELPTYFGYVMPRLATQMKNGWTAWLVSAFALALQHSFLPFIPDGRFFLWRLGMFIPFALFIGLVLKLRPSLLPYAAIIHGLLDISTMAVYFML
jgi:membrane protease YdiL (CAAX protease family)